MGERRQAAAGRLAAVKRATKAVEEAREARWKAEREELAKRGNCPTCGRFLTADGQCPKVFYDDYAGGWEHG